MRVLLRSWAILVVFVLTAAVPNKIGAQVLEEEVINVSRSSGAHQEIISTVSSTLERFGYRRLRGTSTWTKKVEEAILMIDLERDRAGTSVNIDLGTYFLAAGPLEVFDIRDAHVTAGIEKVALDRRRVVQLLNVSNEIDRQTRDHELRELIEMRMLPWMENVFASPRKFVSEGVRVGGRTKLGMILKTATPILDEAEARLE